MCESGLMPFILQVPAYVARARDHKCHVVTVQLNKSCVEQLVSVHEAMLSNAFCGAVPVCVCVRRCPHVCVSQSGSGRQCGG